MSVWDWTNRELEPNDQLFMWIQYPLLSDHLGNAISPCHLDYLANRFDLNDFAQSEHDLQTGESQYANKLRHEIQSGEHDDFLNTALDKTLTMWYTHDTMQ